MNKKIIAAAIAAVVAAPAVSAADTTLYGKAHVSIQSNDNGANDNYSVNSNSSRLGVKGSEDLGNGLKAIFQMEMDYNMTDGGAAGTPIKARDAFVGLSGGFGTFIAGRHDTPAKMAFYSTGIDLIADSIVDINKVAGSVKVGALGLNTLTDFRVDNAIAYVSPSFSGFTVAGAVVPGESKTLISGSAAPKADSIADAYSLGAMYAGGGLKASLGYEVADKEMLGSAADHKMWQAGVSYTFGDFYVGASYEDDSDYAGQKGIDRTAWAIAAKANFGNNYVMANYGTTDADAGNGGVQDADGYGIAVGHKFSKRTQVYAAYHATDFDAKGTDDTSAFALGMIHNF